MKKTTVSLLEDDQASAENIISTIGTDKTFQFKKWYKNGKELFNGLAGYEPDIIILDFELPDTDAIKVLEKFKLEGIFSGKSLVFTVFEKEVLLIQAIALGASGYLLKGITPELLLSELNCIRLGGSSISASLSSHILENLAEANGIRNVNLTSSLSKREEEVLTLLSIGYTYEMAARKLNISVSTIRSYISNIYEKLGVKNRADAIEKGFTTGIINRFRSSFFQGNSKPK